MTKCCSRCKAQESDTCTLTLRQDLFPFGEPEPLCDFCSKVRDSMLSQEHRCYGCKEIFSGRDLHRYQHATICPTCNVDFTPITVSEVPKNGYTEDMVGKDVIIVVDGVHVPDTILQAGMPDGRIMIGPGSILGGVIARQQHIRNGGEEPEHDPNMDAFMQMFQGINIEIRKDDDEDDEEGGASNFNQRWA